jgi:hypothetical protein
MQSHAPTVITAAHPFADLDRLGDELLLRADEII